MLLIDNYDSFTYNLVQCFYTLNIEIKVVRSQELSVEECLALNPACLVVGPGPGAPSQAGISSSLISSCAGLIPVLGVCLGHQCMAEIFGGKIVRAKKPMHGKTSEITHDEKGVFANLQSPLTVMRYHSLIIEKSSLPADFEITAETNEGEIMGIRHRFLQLEGIQFHPESIGTPSGFEMLKNFIELTKESRLC